MNYDALKIARLMIAGMVFLALFSVQGMDERQIQSAFLTVLVMATFATFLRNMWLTLFLWWTMYLYIVFRFTGTIYFFNIFFGCLLYFLTKVSYKKEHIDHFIKIIIIFACCNIGFMLLQFLDLDFYYYLNVVSATGEHRTLNNSSYLAGFMGLHAGMGILMALTIPLVATRKPKWAIWASLLLFLPLYVSKSSIALIAGCVAFLFVLFFRIKRIYWAGLVLVGILAASLYIVKFDMPGGGLRGVEGRLKQWKVVMRDATRRPLRGHGLDSFRNHTKASPEKYCETIEKTEKGWHVTVWDNPHNLLVSLFFEFGIIAWLLLGGYLRDYFKAFVRASKDKNTIATTGFLLVFFIVSAAQFPMFLACLAVFIIPMFALAEKQIGLYSA
ncbi:MAG: O-antigen ligase family protein [Candidatus Hydrothermarchaeales archaeon]